MKLIIGLGNPGKKYAKTRHNIGFMMADKLKEEWNFPDFEFSKKFGAEISEGKISVSSRAERSRVEGSRNNTASNIKILLIKPRTFMNRSGEAVKKIMNFYKMKPADLIIIHDDLDIDLGKYKISTDSSAAGHRGVESIITALGTKNFKRLRIGIEGTALRQKRKIPGDEFVLKNFTPSENRIIQKISGDMETSLQKLLE
jgi:PTH1 family peptidyl-tRNA hydrolase